MQKFIIRPARPQGVVKAISFRASLALVSLMLASGIVVRTHPLYPDRFVVKESALTASQIIELADREDFFYLGTVSFLSTTPGSNFTHTSDATWNNSSNTVEVIGAGGSGGAGQQSNCRAAGGGGGEYGKTTNFSFATPGTTTATCRVGLGGAGVSTTASGSTNVVNGNPGGDTWFNGTTQAGATLGAIGGGAGAAQLSAGGQANGGTGGTGGVGTTHFAGGRGGNAASGIACSAGGGGAGGTTGAGNQGVDNSTASTGSNGGAGGATNGGTAGSGATTSGSETAGGTGTAWDGTHGAGGGGGALRIATNAAVTSVGAGGLYGGGSGGIVNNGGGNNSATRATSASGANGLIVLTWTPSGGAFNVKPTMFLVF